MQVNKSVTSERLLGGMFVSVDGIQRRDGKCRIRCHVTSNPDAPPSTIITTQEHARELGLV